MSTALVPVQPRPGRRAERFLQRLAGLTPVEWGRLDAAADRLMADDPVARWQRARWEAAFAAPLAIEPLVVGAVFLLDAVRDLAGRRDDPLEFMRRVRAGAAAVERQRPQAVRGASEFDRLLAIVSEQPGAGRTHVLSLLTHGFVGAPSGRRAVGARVPTDVRATGAGDPARVALTPSTAPGSRRTAALGSRQRRAAAHR